MEISSEIISAAIGLLGGLAGALVTYWSQRPKLKSEARTEAEKADDIIFSRLQIELGRRDERIDGLEKRLADEITKRIRMTAELSEVRQSFDNERNRRRQLEIELAEERALRMSLEKRVAELEAKNRKQAEQIKELQSENNTLHNQNRELARRLDTRELKE